MFGKPPLFADMCWQSLECNDITGHVGKCEGMSGHTRGAMHCMRDDRSARAMLGQVGS